MKKRLISILTVMLMLIWVMPSVTNADLPETTIVDREQQQLEWCFIYSNLLGYNISYISNPRLYSSISNWLNVPYKYSGKSKSGIDCSGFVCEMYKECYSIKLEGSSREMFKGVDQLRRSDLREGDLVFFKINKTRISHVGIYLGQNKFAHASTKKGVMISDLDDPYYQNSFYKGGRVIL